MGTILNSDLLVHIDSKSHWLSFQERWSVCIIHEVLDAIPGFSTTILNLYTNLSSNPDNLTFIYVVLFPGSLKYKVNVNCFWSYLALSLVDSRVHSQSSSAGPDRGRRDPDAKLLFRWFWIALLLETMLLHQNTGKCMLTNNNIKGKPGKVKKNGVCLRPHGRSENLIFSNLSLIWFSSSIFCNRKYLNTYIFIFNEHLV